MCAFAPKDTQEAFAKQVRRRQHSHDDSVTCYEMLK